MTYSLVVSFGKTPAHGKIFGSLQGQEWSEDYILLVRKESWCYETNFYENTVLMQANHCLLIF